MLWLPALGRSTCASCAYQRHPSACRAALLHISAYGPAFGSAAALAAVVIGLGLSAAGVGGSELQPVAFNDSLLVGVLGEHSTFIASHAQGTLLTCSGDWAGPHSCQGWEL